MRLNLYCPCLGTVLVKTVAREEGAVYVFNYAMAVLSQLKNKSLKFLNERSVLTFSQTASPRKCVK